jgi:hypothetical protein
MREGLAGGLCLRTLAVRAVVVAGAYLATALVVLVVVTVLRVREAPDSLRAVLSFYFISALAAGLEPATVKAAVLSGGRAPDDLAGVLAAGAVKGVGAAPILALAGWFADPHTPPPMFLLTPLVAVAGFWATDLRVVLDMRGRHAAAIWLKQGSLAGGFALLALMVGAGVPLFWSALASSLARLAPPAMMALRYDLGCWRVGAFLRDARWPDIAALSAVAAAGGSFDRLLALRYLPPAHYAGYLFVYELFSRFWLIPYLVAPILFARLAAGDASRALISRAWLATLAMGALFVLAVSGLALATPALAARTLGASSGPSVIAFAAAVAIGALTQLRIARMQGSGAVRRAFLITAFGALVAGLSFFVGVRAMGLPGLYWAWLAKSVIEFAAATAWDPDARRA